MMHSSTELYNGKISLETIFYLVKKLCSLNEFYVERHLTNIDYGNVLFSNSTPLKNLFSTKLC